MSVSINFTGELILDQTSGLQADDVNVDATGAVLSGSLDSDFLTFLNTLGLNTTQAAFAADVEGASDPDLVTITADAGETIGKLFFSDAAGDDFDGDLVPGVTTLNGDPLYFWSALNGKAVLIKDGLGTVVAALYIEPTNAAHTTAVVQSITFQPFLHPDANDPNDVVDFSDVLRVSAVITQNAGDHIHVADDAPTIVTSGTPPQLIVDESDLTTDASQDFSGNFTSSFGTDGAGSLVYALGVLSDGADSGLTDTASGEAVLLSLNGGVVEGRTETSDDLVFTVSVDTLGVVTLDQQRAVVHADTSNDDDSRTLAAADLVTLTATITDADGDHQAATLNIGQNLNFEDDGPSISTTGEAPQLTVDESDLTTDATQNFAANFSTAFGEDGAGSLVYSLSVTAGPSGLTDTASGEAVILSLNGGVVEGRTEFGNDLVFTVAIAQNGDVTLDQLRAVVHSDTSDDDDSTTLSGSDLVNVVATITDGDGDSHAASIGIGQNLHFKDDGPTISANDTGVTLTVDETDLTTDASQSFAAQFSSAFGEDGAGGIGYALSATAGPSGLVDTASGQNVILSGSGGLIEGRTEFSNLLVFSVTVTLAGLVTLNQARAVVHADATNPNDSATLSADDLVKLTATITDGDGDHHSAFINIGQNLVFLDDGPSITKTGTPPTLTVDESDFTTDATQNFAANFVPVAGADGDVVSYALGLSAGPSGLVDTLTGQAVSLSLVAGQIVAKDTDGDIVFTVSVNGTTGAVTLNQIRAVTHPDGTNPNDVDTLANDDLILLTATVTDKDGDSASTSLNIGKTLHFIDDAPTITAAVDYPGTDTSLHVGNQVGQSNAGVFGYDIGHDDRPASFYTGGGSDFKDTDGATAGVQISLTGTVGAAATPITQAVATLASESASSAVFNFSFHYDKDPITAGVQDATAGGTLTFNKVADTFTVAINDVVDGFDFSVLHTNELLAKQPTGNTGHPNIVVEQLSVDNPSTPAHEGFYVQFTADNSPFGFSSNGQGGNTADKAFTGANHDMVGGTPTWVSATQSTNGVAGDTIQSGENLTLRFFDENILSDVANNIEKTVPTDSVGGIALKFDGIGANEDLVMILDLIDTVTHQTITRAVTIENGDIYKHTTPGGVPAPYNSEFTLDNNDGLVIIEANDYNAAGEHYEIQGVQIMQSANGLTGSGINLNKAIGTTGGSNATGSLQAFDFAGSHTTDVLKITDIGFVEQTTGTLDANLDFGFQLADADADLTAMQHILVNVSNDFIV